MWGADRGGVTISYAGYIVPDILPGARGPQLAPWTVGTPARYGGFVENMASFSFLPCIPL